MGSRKFNNALSSPVAASVAAVVGRFLLLGTGALTGIVIPLTMSVESVGVFFLAQSIIAALATVGQLGLSITAPAFISSAQGHRDGGQLKQIIRRTLVLGILSCLLIAIGFNVFMHVFSQFQNSELLDVMHKLAPLVSACMILAAMTTIVAEQHRAIGHFVQASFLVTGASIATAGTVLLAWRTDFLLDLHILILAGMVGAGCSVLLGAYSLRRWYRTQHEQKPITDVSYGSLLKQTYPNLTTSFILFIMLQADLWIIAYYADTAGIAIYGLASRLAALVLIPLAVINTVVAPSIGRIWVRKKIRYLQRVLGVGAAAAISLGLSGYLIFIVFGKFLLVSVWSEEYSDAYFIFAILGLSQLMQTYAGTAGFVLMMLNKQHVMMRISVGSGLTMIAVGLVVMGQYGIVGLAVVYSAGGIAQSLAQIVCVNRIFGLETTANFTALRRFARSYYRKKVNHGS